MRKLTMEDLDKALQLYTALIGSPGCTWDEHYPNRDVLAGDIESGDLYGEFDEVGELLAAAALCGSEELDEVPIATAGITKAGALARVGVSPAHQHSGLAKKLITALEAEAVKRGLDGIRLLVAPDNARAIRLYEQLGYQNCGGIYAYETDWLIYERRLA